MPDSHGGSSILARADGTLVRPVRPRSGLTSGLTSIALSAALVACTGGLPPPGSPDPSTSSQAAAAETPTLSAAVATASIPVRTSAPTVPPTATPEASAPAVAIWHRSLGIPPPSEWRRSPLVIAMNVRGRLVIDSRHAADGGVPIWTSSDGIDWSRASRSDRPASDTELWMSAMSPGGPGLVAVGEDRADVSTSSIVHVWMSVDGQKWDPVEDSGLKAGFDLHLVASSPAGLVMFGSMPCPDRVCPPETWVSSDGQHWRLISSATADEVSRHSEVLVSSDGGVNAFLSRGEQPAEIWRSEDLVHWRRIAILPGPAACCSFRAAVGPHGWVVTDQVRSIWASTDGQEWHRGEFPPATWILALVAVPSGFVAAGFRESGAYCQDDVGESFVSSDGLSWTMVPDQDIFSTASIAGLVINGETLVGIGDDAQTAGAAVWTANVAALDALMTTAPAGTAATPTPSQPSSSTPCAN